MPKHMTLLAAALAGLADVVFSHFHFRSRFSSHSPYTMVINNNTQRHTPKSQEQEQEQHQQQHHQPAQEI